MSRVSPSPDLAFGAFSDHGPWPIDPERSPGAPASTRCARRAQAEVPELVRRRMLPPLRPLRRGGGAARRRRSRAGSCASAARAAPASRAGLSRRLRRAFERLGPAYIKLGQIVSSGQGLFPPELVDEFKRCRDQVPAEPFAVVRRVVEEDLGGPLERSFASLRRAADRGGVDRAGARGARCPAARRWWSRCSGRRSRAWCAATSRPMAWIAPLLVGRIPVAALANPPALVELFAETIVEELDFRLEAQNMLDVARVLREAGQTHHRRAAPASRRWSRGACS